MYMYIHVRSSLFWFLSPCFSFIHPILVFARDVKPREIRLLDIRSREPCRSGPEIVAYSNDLTSDRWINRSLIRPRNLFPSPNRDDSGRVSVISDDGVSVRNDKTTAKSCSKQRRYEVVGGGGSSVAATKC